MRYLCDMCMKKQVIEGQEYCWHGGKPLYLFDKAMLTLFGCEYEAWHRMEVERVKESYHLHTEPCSYCAQCKQRIKAAEWEDFAKGLIAYSNRMGIYNCEEAVKDYLESLRSGGK